MDQWVEQLGYSIKHYKYIDALNQLQSLSAQEHEALRIASPSFYRYLHTLASSIEHSLRTEKIYDEMSFARFKEAYDEAFRISVNTDMSESVNRQAEARIANEARRAEEVRRARNIIDRQAAANRRGAERAAAGYKRPLTDKERKKLERDAQTAAKAAARIAELAKAKENVAKLNLMYAEFKEQYHRLYTGLKKKDKIIRLAREWLNIDLHGKNARGMRIKLHPDHERNSVRKLKKTILSGQINNNF
jgi:hypothetical protein